MREGAAPRLRPAGPPDRRALPVGPVLFPEDRPAAPGSAVPVPPLLRRPVVRRGGGRLPGAQDAAGRRRGGAPGERADLRHLEPAAPDAGTAGRAGRGGRDPPGGGGLGEALPLRPVRPAARFLPVRPGHVSLRRGVVRAAAASARRSGDAPGRGAAVGALRRLAQRTDGEAVHRRPRGPPRDAIALIRGAAGGFPSAGRLWYEVCVTRRWSSP